MSSFRTLANPPYDVNVKPKREKLTRSRDGQWFTDCGRASPFTQLLLPEKVVLRAAFAVRNVLECLKLAALASPASACVSSAWDTLPSGHPGCRFETLSYISPP
jgi:hypothetical protein